jgi:hypothetical protein
MCWRHVPAANTLVSKVWQHRLVCWCKLLVVAAVAEVMLDLGPVTSAACWLEWHTAVVDDVMWETLAEAAALRQQHRNSSTATAAPQAKLPSSCSMLIGHVAAGPAAGLCRCQEAS